MVLLVMVVQHATKVGAYFSSSLDYKGSIQRWSHVRCAVWERGSSKMVMRRKGRRRVEWRDFTSTCAAGTGNNAIRSRCCRGRNCGVFKLLLLMVLLLIHQGSYDGVQVSRDAAAADCRRIATRSTITIGGGVVGRGAVAGSVVWGALLL